MVKVISKTRNSRYKDEAKKTETKTTTMKSKSCKYMNKYENMYAVHQLF